MPNNQKSTLSNNYCVVLIGVMAAICGIVGTCLAILIFVTGEDNLRDMLGGGKPTARPVTPTITRAPTTPTTDPEVVWEQLQRAQEYANQGDYEEAIIEFGKVIELASSGELGDYTTSAYFQRGFCYREIRKYYQAIDDFDKTIELDPYNSAAHLYRAFSYDALGNDEQALKDYDKTIGLNPDYTYAYYYRGRLHRNLGNYEQALKDYQRYLELDPNASDRAEVENIITDLKYRLDP